MCVSLAVRRIRSLGSELVHVSCLTWVLGADLRFSMKAVRSVTFEPSFQHLLSLNINLLAVCCIPLCVTVAYPPEKTAQTWI